MGGETPLDMAPGVAEYALPFRTIADAYRLEERLRILEESDADKIRVAIVGAGYCGVELACKLAERLGERGRLRLIELSDLILRTLQTLIEKWRIKPWMIGMSGSIWRLGLSRLDPTRFRCCTKDR
jgi:NADH dehydrogenase FAD-containing subunit